MIVTRLAIVGQINILLVAVAVVVIIVAVCRLISTGVKFIRAHATSIIKIGSGW